MKRFLLALTLFTAWAVLGSAAQAGLIFVPNTYGLSARSIGLGNAMTAVGDDYSMAFFNPGALGLLETNQLDLGYLYAEPNFEGGLENGDDVQFDTANKITLIGFSMDLSEIFTGDRGLGLGLDIAIDNNLKSFLNFEDSRNDNGQFLRYGLCSVTVVTGLGVEIIPQLYLGGGGFVMVKGKNKLIAETDMAGNTKEEEIQVSAEPAIAPIVSLFAPVTPDLTFGVVYRGKGVAEFTEIDAETEALVSDSPLTNLNLVMAFKDTYVPQQVALGGSYWLMEELMVALDVTWANWADYDDEVSKGDVVKEDGEFETKDIYIPRLGIEYTPVENLFLRFGYYFEETPFVDPGIGNTVVLDNSKHVGSFGIGYDATTIPFLNHPLSLGVTYFYHYLVPRTVEAGDGREFESSGDLNGLVGTLTLRF